MSDNVVALFKDGAAATKSPSGVEVQEPAYGTPGRVSGEMASDLELLRASVRTLDAAHAAVLGVVKRSELALADLRAASNEMAALRDEALHVAETSERISDVIERGDLEAALRLQVELQAERSAARTDQTNGHTSLPERARNSATATGPCQTQRSPIDSQLGTNSGGS